HPIGLGWQDSACASPGRQTACWSCSFLCFLFMKSAVASALRIVAGHARLLSMIFLSAQVQFVRVLVVVIPLCSTRVLASAFRARPFDYILSMKLLLLTSQFRICFHCFVQLLV